MMRLENVTSPAGSFAYSYLADTYDRVSQLLLPNDESPNYGAIENSYNDYLRRLKSTTLGTQLWGSERDYSYDSGSEVTQQVVSVGTLVGNTAYRYENYSYDNIGQLESAQGFDGRPGYGSNPARLQEQFGYVYDKAWNLNTRTNNALVQSFTVNNLNELTRVSRSGTLTVAGTATEPSGISPTYANPGVTSVTVNTTNAIIYSDGTYAATNFMPVAAWTTYTAVAHDNIGRADTNTVSVFLPGNDNMDFDLNGNLLRERSAAGGTNRNFAYDDENQLTAVWIANAWSNSFAYDGLLRKRTEKDYSWTGSSWQETNEVRFIYDGYLVVQERDVNNLPRVTYTRGNDLSGDLQAAGGIGGLLARTDMGLWVANEPFASAYYFSDAQGNVVAMVGTNGAMEAQYQYDPFGNLLVKSGALADANRYRFSSKEWNDAAGIYNYGFRFYDPNLQRWLNRDPLQEKGGVNLYGFVLNNPIRWGDILGLCDTVPNLLGSMGGVSDLINSLLNQAFNQSLQQIADSFDPFQNPDQAANANVENDILHDSLGASENLATQYPLQGGPNSDNSIAYKLVNTRIGSFCQRVYNAYQKDTNLHPNDNSDFQILPKVSIQNPGMGFNLSVTNGAGSVFSFGAVGNISTRNGGRTGNIRGSISF